jgi:hypothetical protein
VAALARRWRGDDAENGQVFYDRSLRRQALPSEVPDVGVVLTAQRTVFCVLQKIDAVMRINLLVCLREPVSQRNRSIRSESARAVLLSL